MLRLACRLRAGAQRASASRSRTRLLGLDLVAAQQVDSYSQDHGGPTDMDSNIAASKLGSAFRQDQSERGPHHLSDACVIQLPK